ncbi:MAG: hypothetical protein ACL9RN_12100 [Cylindrospermopsis raciborskii]|jgi:hypothetical protein|uniref:hypothetical protein n=1 Tax=Cylindrospermopsis raciborskii TaxID=77022 RepID=UPI003D0B6B14
MNYPEILNLVINVVRETGEFQEKQLLVNPTESTRLFGDTLNSMELVMLIAELEERIADQFGVRLILADDRAMSRKTSPFLSIKTLVNYIEFLLAN